MSSKEQSNNAVTLLEELGYEWYAETSERISWFENGQMKMKLQGKAKPNHNRFILSGFSVTWWYKNGQMESDEPFTYSLGCSMGVCPNGKSGTYTYWYENGQKKLSASWKDSIKNGKWIEWYEDGQIKSQKIYKDDECISGDCFT